MDVIQWIVYPAEINTRVEGSLFIPQLKELQTSQLPTCLQTTITSSLSENFLNYFLHFMLRSPGL